MQLTRTYLNRLLTPFIISESVRAATLMGGFGGKVFNIFPMSEFLEFLYPWSVQ